METSPPFIPSKPRVRRKRRGVPATPPPAALVLVAAVYTDSPRMIRLTFGRAIDIAGLDGNQITLDDGNFGVRYVATGPATLFDATTADIELNELEPFGGTGVLLSATGASGIVAVDDGGTWAGVVNLAV